MDFAKAKEAKLKRRAMWPPEVRDKNSKVFTSVINLDDRRVEIRSHKGGNFWAMFKDKLATGNTRTQALARLIKLILPCDEVRDASGRRID